MRTKHPHIPSWSLVCLGLTLLATGRQKTGKLSSDLNARFEKEGIVRRAEDLTFRRTIAAGQRVPDGKINAPPLSSQKKAYFCT